MTIRQKWSEAAGAISTGITPPQALRFFADAFAVDEEDLPLLGLLEAQGHLRYTSTHRLALSPEAWIKAIDKLLWLGWVVPGAAGWGEFAYSASAQYRQRLQLWERKEWQETATGYQPGYPAEEDMAFPMKKEVYEEKLEHLSDDLQGLQLNYAEGSMFDDELNEEERQALEREKAFILELIEVYEAWKAYVPKYWKES